MTLVLLLLILLSLILIGVLVYWRTRKAEIEPIGTVLNTRLDFDPPSKVDNIMVEADLPKNFDYFIELLVKKLNETAKEISTKKLDDSDLASQYHGGLIYSALAKFKELNNSLPANQNKNGKLLTKALSKSNNKQVDVKTDLTSISEEDVEQLIDLNENLITVVYPCLLS